MHRTLLSNIGSNLSLLVVRVCITFVMTPLYLRVLGKQDYGIWEILTVLIGYMGILDIGIKPTVGRYISKYAALNDLAEVRRVFSTACLFMFCMGILSAALLLISGHVWFVFFAGDNAEPRYILLLSLVAINLVVRFPYLAIEGAFEGFQKYTTKNLLSIVMAVSMSVLLYYYIDLYDGLLMLATLSSSFTVIKYFVGTALLRMPRNGGLTFSLADCSWRVFRRSLVFGTKSFIQGIASRVQIGSDRVIIGLFLGPAAVPAYSIPANLISHFRNIGWTITDAFMPLFSSLDARNEQDALRRVYLKASRFCIGMLLPISIGTILLGGPFMAIWLGNGFREDAEKIIPLLVTITMLPFINPFSTRYLTAVGRHGLLAKLYPVAAVMTILLSILFVKPLGIVGVALGALIPTLIITPIILTQCCKGLGLTVYDYLRRSLYPSLPPSLVLILVVSAYRKYSGLPSFPYLLAAVVLGAVCYLAVFAFTGLRQDERRWMLAIARKFTGWQAG